MLAHSRVMLMTALAATVLLALFPLYGPAIAGQTYEFLLERLSYIMILAVLAMSLDLLVGVAGLVSLGHAAFYGLGAYSLAVLTPDSGPISVWIALLGALGAASIGAAIIGGLSIRTSGIYFIMVTLAFGQMLFYLFHDSKIAGGSDGAYVFFEPEVTIAGVTLLDLGDELTFFYVMVALFIGVYLLLRHLMGTPFGHVLMGIGENEGRVKALGYDTFAYKLVAFVIAGAIGGLAGLMFAIQDGYVPPNIISWHKSGEVLVMVILGGMGSLIGPALGAFLLELLKLFFQDISDHWLLLMGGSIILMVLLLRRGIAGLIEDVAARVRAKPRVAPEPDAPPAAEEPRGA